ncbi:serine hydrolase domain-containing protein, partial [Bacteroidota bacterium]
VKIDELIENIKDGDFGDIHSLLAFKENKLFLEEYFAANGQLSGSFINNHYRDKKQVTASASKSIISALVGIAIDQDFIEDVNLPIYSVFPDYSDLFNENKKQITLKHLLTMTSGLKWYESTMVFNDDALATTKSDDPVKYILSKSLVRTPGTAYKYNTGLTMLLTKIIERKSGISCEQFARDNLFEPLGIKDFKFTEYSEFYLRSRDLLKLGILYLNDGIWNGKQIIPNSWIRESTKPNTDAGIEFYGYKWWYKSQKVNGDDIKSYYAMGFGGNFIAIFPDINMVIVSTAQNYDENWKDNFYNMTKDYLLPAVIAKKQI